MARYWARLNSANVVEQVEKIQGFDGKSDAECIKYLKSIFRNENWKEGFKSNPNPKGQMPSVGMIYLTEHDVFIHQKPYPSWTLSSDKKSWVSPVPYPVTYTWTSDQAISAEELAIAETIYTWNENTQSWVS